MSDNDNRPANQNNRSNIAQTAALMMALTLISKCIGFVRELIFAGAYGTGYIVDAYVMAQGIPGIILSGVLSAIGTAYTPVFSGITETQGKASGRRFTDQIITLVLVLSLVVSVFGIAFSRQLVGLFAPNFDERTAQLTSFYLRIAFCYNLVSNVCSVVNAFLQYNGEFLRQIIAGFAYNLCLISAILISVRINHYYLIFGLLAGEFCRCFLMLQIARRFGYHYRPALAAGAPIRQVLTLAVPVFVGSSFGQINAIVDRFLASGLPEGSVSALSYGSQLNGLVASLTTGIIITIFYPKVAKAVSRGDWTTVESDSQRVFILLLILAVPLTLGAISFSEPVVQVIYERNAFDEASTALVATAFRYYSVGLVFSAVNGLVGGIFNAMSEMRITVICGMIGILFNVALNLALVGPMQHGGLALATSITIAVNFIMLSFFMRRKHGQLRFFPPLKKVLRICGASILAVLAAILVYRAVTLVWMPRIIYLGLAVIAASAVYLLLLKLLRVEEVDVLKGLIMR